MRPLPTDSANRNGIPIKDLAYKQALLAALHRTLWIAFACVFPLAATSFLWRDIFRGVSAAALDGSGHYAMAQIYDRLIFPETFGWTNAYFAGMSFPNFYPPLFFWCVSLLRHTSLVSFATAFKLVLLIPLFLTPGAIWIIAKMVTDQNEQVARYSAWAILPLFIFGRSFTRTSGLDVFSTLLTGFYTQPLGFTLLLTWLAVYLPGCRPRWRFITVSVLLALTVLANFFNAITASFFITAALVNDLVKWCRAIDSGKRTAARADFMAHLLSPLVAFALTAFWLVPMLSAYQYLVTRPFTPPLTQIIEPPLLVWYAVAAIGIMAWMRRPTSLMWPFVGACMGLAVGLVFSSTLAPRWFPLQSFRFLSTLNFLLAVPVAMGVLFLTQRLLGTRKRGELEIKQSNHTYAQINKTKRIIFASIVSLGIILFAAFTSDLALPAPFAFYTPGNIDRINGVLDFARQRRAGRYLVEVPSDKWINPINRFDSLALNAYLGSQGNETISIVYREASPNASFFNAELNAFSAYKENFGLSSTLMDDVDFINQPLAQHLSRLQFIGVRYLVIATPEMKERLSREPDIGTRHDIGAWTIFELRQPVLSEIRPLQYRPALVISDFTLKLRRQNQYDFVRLAEEQFSDAWFDVLLVRSPELRIDRVHNLDQFGALIVDTYECEDEGRAFAQLKEFAQTRTLILLSSEASLLARIKSSIANFPHAVVIQRKRESSGDWVEAMEPTHGYDSSSIRQVWKAIRLALDNEKVSVAPTQIRTERSANRIDLEPEGTSPEQSVPVLIAMTYHPKWVRSDGDQLYATSPFFTLAFINQPIRLRFQRNRYDRVALCGSLATLLMLGVFAGMSSRSLLKKAKGDESTERRGSTFQKECSDPPKHRG